MEKENPKIASITENDNPEIVPITEQEPEKIDIGELISMAGDYLISAQENQNDNNLKIAEINKPINEKQLELQELQLKNQHDAWSKVADANISKEKREIIINSIIVGAVLFFLMICAFILLYKNEYQIAFSIVTLLIGFIGGYFAKTQTQKSDQKN